jgi:hypothetical protein
MKHREREHVRSLINKLASAYAGRAILRWSKRLTKEADREILELRQKLLRQGVSPIELIGIEAELAEDAEKLERLGRK